MQSTSTTITPAAQLGPSLGYRFFGDQVELNATFHLLQRQAHDLAWALQLWACPANPTFSQELAGHLVAEAALPPMAEVADTGESFMAVVPAQPPAGDRDYSMVLVLIARRGPVFDGVHDLASLPMRERFILPRFAGPVTYQLDGERVKLSVARVENPRPEDNLSGTIALELWALPDPYVGGGFRGHALAGATLGTLAGQSAADQLVFDLDADRPPVGVWHIVAMVREWVGEGYLTRDFVNLGPLTIAKPEPVVPVAAPAAPAVVSAPPPVAPPPAVVAPAPAATPAAVRTTRKAAPAAKSTSGKVSVNDASLDELVTVKGLPRPVAERLTQERPFKSLEELTRVKGVGEKLLAKVRTYLKV